MSIQLPSEVVVERFLPTARTMLATELDAQGLTQQEIADWVGVSQAAVSKYLNGAATVEDRLRDDPRMRNTVERVAAGIATGSMDEYEALGEILALVREFEDRGPICELHEEEMPALRGLGCDLCVRGFDSEVATERAVLTDVRKAVRVLADAAEIVPLVPNVGTNVGRALADASDELDVAAVPGRIHTMHGRINVPSNPEFGASKHVARTILAAISVDGDVRAALNLKTDERLLDAARELGIEPMAFDADYEDRTRRLERSFEGRGAVPRVVYHEGAFGIEPVTYVFGQSAVDAAELAVRLARSLD